MNKQPEALRLAEYLDLPHIGQHKSAAELRRLHAENEMLWKEREEPHQKVAMYVRECNRLEDERDELRKVNAELLGALKRISATKNLARELEAEWCPAAGDMVRMARAAIEAALKERNT
jgi:hypothetical protein